MKPGYKQTEVGVIPVEWDAGSLGRIWNVIDCKHVTAQFVPDGFPLASIREVQSRFVDLTTAKQTTAYFYNQLIEGGRKPRPGDMILSRNATVGEVAQVADWHPPFAMGQDVCLLRKKEAGQSTEFLQAVFQSPIILNQLANLMVGSTFKRANVQQIRDFSVPMPPLPEQRAIATALSDVDGLLGALDRLIAKKRDLKQAAMQQLLTGQTRLPGFKGVWVVKTLGELGSFTKGSGIKKDESQSGALPCIRYGEIYTRHHDYIKEFHSFISAAVAATATLLKQGDLLFAGSGETKAEIGKCVAFVDDCEAYAGGDIVILRPQGVDSLFLGFSLNTPAINRQKASRGQGDAVVHIGSSALADIALNLPPLPEQTAIATVLSETDLELAGLEQRREKTRALKQGMMQELLTGRTRLVASPQQGGRA